MFDLPTVPELGLESVAGLPQDQFHHVEGDVATQYLAGDRRITEITRLSCPYRAGQGNTLDGCTTA